MGSTGAYRRRVAPLTDGQIRTAAPGQIRDGQVPGLQLRVRASGASSWMLSYRARGSRRVQTLLIGRYPEVSIAEARRLALDARAAIRLGRDPAGEFRAQRQAEREGRGRTVAALLGAHLEAASSSLRPKTASDWQGIAKRIEREHPRFARTPADTLTRGAARLFLDQVQARAQASPRGTDGRSSALRAQQLMSRAFSWSMERGGTEHNPFARQRLERPTPRQTVLAPAEIAAVLAALEQLRHDGDQAGYYFELLWLTNVRPEEGARGRWVDVDIEEALWTLPATLTKTHAERPVPLSEPAVRLLEQIPRAGDWLFPAPTSVGHIVESGGSNWLARIRRLSDVKRFTAKSIQHTIATLMTEQLGIDGRLADLCKGHLPPKMARTYNRAFWEIEAQRRAFERWGRYLDRLAGRGRGAKVVRI